MLWQHAHSCIRSRLASTNINETLRLRLRLEAPQCCRCLLPEHGAGVDGLRPEGFLALWNCRHVVKSAAQRVVDKLLKPNIPHAAQPAEFSGDVIVDRQGRSHASRHDFADGLM